jgi:YYY domain-containing protein
MFDFLRFWLVLELLGLIALPLAWRVLAPLPDRGYAFARSLGLLGVGYILWLATGFGLLRHTVGGVVLAVLAFAGLSLGWGRSAWQRTGEGERPLLAFWRREYRYVLATELFFLLAMAGWTYFRRYNPDIAGTEKPMEFAFLNGILNSTRFPPHDPWLAGYGISYYYFGYVILALLVQLTGVVPGVAFNLGLAAVFALTLVGSFGLVYNLVRGDESPGGASPSFRRGLGFGLLGALLLGVMGNLEGVLEVLHARGLLSPGLHAFFDVKELASAPVTGSWNPGSSHWWWWRASRVIHDYDFSRQFDQEVISEFPIFSFLLGDMHPHVLALPFVLLALALALALFRRPLDPAEETAGDDRQALWNRAIAAFGLHGGGLLFYGLVLGALGFLNTWDFPIYVFLTTLVYALRRARHTPLSWRTLGLESGLVFAVLTAVGLIGFLPFYLGFRSQAGGIWPNFYNPTRWVQYVLMFGPFLVALIFLLIGLYRQWRPSWGQWGRWTAAFWLLPLAFLMLATILAAVIPGIRSAIESTLGRSAGELIPQLVRIRASSPGTWLFVGLLLATLGAFLGRVLGGEALNPRPAPHLLFVLALFFTGLLLTYGVEFAFLRDTFGTRMNTVFKFYYQAWILMALGSAYALHYLGSRAGRGLRLVAGSVVTVFVLGGLIYPAFAIPAKANGFQGEATLDGTAFVARYRPDEAAVIAWLQAHAPPDAVIVEAPGGSYTDYNTISAHTGRPTLLGWGGHELQWRGNYREPGRREPLIETIYRNLDEDAIRAIVAEFNIRYLIVGPREVEKYRITPDRRRAFVRLWQPVFDQGEYTVYLWRGG